MLIELRVEFLCYLLSCEQSVLQYDPQGEGQEKQRTRGNLPVDNTSLIRPRDKVIEES